MSSRLAGRSHNPGRTLEGDDEAEEEEEDPSIESKLELVLR